MMTKQRRYYFLTLFLIILCGCNELVQVSGMLLDRVNYHSFTGELVVSVKDFEGNYVSGVQVSVTRSDDSTCVFSPKLTGDRQPVLFLAPDEQINSIECDTEKLNIEVFVAGGLLLRQISVTAINPDKPIFLEFTISPLESNHGQYQSRFQRFKY